MNSTHLDILLDTVDIIGKRVRAAAKNAVGDPDRDYWLADVIGELDELNTTIAEVRRELKGRADDI